MEQKTPLYDCHMALGAKMTVYAGYATPVYFTDIIAEHMAVREKAGVFDVSHMGELEITGPDALSNLNRALTNDFTGMPDGGARYSLMCNENGGVVDDMIVYRKSRDEYMLAVNASNRAKVAERLRGSLSGAVSLEDASDATALLALQGPRSGDILAKLCADGQAPVKPYTFCDGVSVGGVKCLLSRTGYTGESGYELYCAARDAAVLWNALLEAGEGSGLLPCGLGARDTLRFEAALPLYGHEMDESVNPFETGLAFAVKMDKSDFVGKSALTKRGAPALKRVGLKIVGRGIAREQNPVYFNGRRTGTTTSGVYCPYLGGAYAMALVKTGAGAEIAAVRGACVNADTDTGSGSGAGVDKGTDTGACVDKGTDTGAYVDKGTGSGSVVDFAVGTHAAVGSGASSGTFVSAGTSVAVGTNVAVGTRASAGTSVAAGTSVFVEVRGRMLEAVITALPFYRRKN